MIRAGHKISQESHDAVPSTEHPVFVHQTIDPTPTDTDLRNAHLDLNNASLDYRGASSEVDSVVEFIADQKSGPGVAQREVPYEQIHDAVVQLLDLKIDSERADFESELAMHVVESGQRR